MLPNPWPFLPSSPLYPRESCLEQAPTLPPAVYRTHSKIQFQGRRRSEGQREGSAEPQRPVPPNSSPLHSGLRTRCLGSGNLSPGSSPGKQAQQKCGSWLTVVPYLPLPAWQVSCSQCWDLLCTLPRHFPGYASSLRRRHCSAQTFQAHCTPALTHSGRKAWKSHRKSHLHGILHTHRPALLSSVGV